MLYLTSSPKIRHKTLSTVTFHMQAVAGCTYRKSKRGTKTLRAVVTHRNLAKIFHEEFVTIRKRWALLIAMSSRGEVSYSNMKLAPSFVSSLQSPQSFLQQGFMESRKLERCVDYIHRPREKSKCANRRHPLTM
jgi:transcriptional regulator of heat shock response